jgi:hypothetical protein
MQIPCLAFSILLFQGRHETGPVTGNNAHWTCSTPMRNVTSWHCDQSYRLMCLHAISTQILTCLSFVIISLFHSTLYIFFVFETASLNSLTKESRLWSSWLWYDELLQVLTNVSEEHTASVFRSELFYPGNGSSRLLRTVSNDVEEHTAWQPRRRCSELTAFRGSSLY